MSKEKKSILSKIFKGSSGCNCGVEIVENEDKKANPDKEDGKKQDK
ncbi:hypothetical protein R9X47_13630 [Wukongibacter baidiensis]